MAVYIQIEGVKGNVQAEGHEDWIEADSLQFGVGRSISTRTGATKDREASAPTFSEIVFTKEMDVASPHLFTESCVGKAKKVDVHLVMTNLDKLETFCEYALGNCLISGYSVSSGGDRPSESVTLNFNKFEMKYIPWKDDHTKDSPIPAGYDIGLGKKI